MAALALRPAAFVAIYARRRNIFWGICGQTTQSDPIEACGCAFNSLSTLPRSRMASVYGGLHSCGAIDLN
jgi:hypothetical protein